MKTICLLPIFCIASLLLAPCFSLRLHASDASANSNADSGKGGPLLTKSWWEEWMQQDYMLGDWGGYRTKLSQDYGVNFEFCYYSAVPVNLAGGIKKGAVYEGLLWMAMDISSEKLAGFPGGHLFVSSVWIHGEPFSQDYVGDVNLVSLLDLPHSFRLLELYYEQKFWDNRFSIKIGQLSIDRDFIVPDLYNTISSINFFNQNLFYPTVAFGVFDRAFYPIQNHGLASTPYATPGIRLRLDPDPRSYLQAGIYGGKPDISYHGVAFPLSRDEGALCYFEAGYRINMAPDDAGLPGSYKFGGYYHTDGFVDNDSLLTLFGLPASGQEHGGNYGFYLLAEQTVFFEEGKKDPAGQGLIAFARGAYAPADRNFFTWGADAGLVYKGLIPGREYDTLGVAFSYLSASDDLVDTQRKINKVVPGTFPDGDYEAFVEVNYKAQITPWMTAQTSIQRVFHPGARLVADTPNAWVFIAQTSFRF